MRNWLRAHPARSAALGWGIFAVWLTGSLGLLGFYEYEAAMRGLMCIAFRQ